MLFLMAVFAAVLYFTVLGVLGRGIVAEAGAIPARSGRAVFFAECPNTNSNPEIRSRVRESWD